jgi:hypothetical protein
MWLFIHSCRVQRLDALVKSARVRIRKPQGAMCLFPFTREIITLPFTPNLRSLSRLQRFNLIIQTLLELAMKANDLLPRRKKSHGLKEGA